MYKAFDPIKRYDQILGDEFARQAEFNKIPTTHDLAIALKKADDADEKEKAYHHYKNLLELMDKIDFDHKEFIESNAP